MEEYNFYKKISFNNGDRTGMLMAREKLADIKKTNKVFLKKHPNLCEDYNFIIDTIEDSIELEYFIKEVDNAEEN